MTNYHGVFSSCYLAPIAYYHLLFLYENNFLDTHENFIKQTYRNRCTILAANGKLDLIIPIQKKGKPTPMKDIKISYNENWQLNHWRSIESAYRKSPFFEYFEFDLSPFYHSFKPEYLIDFNETLFEKVNELIGLDLKIEKANNYIDYSENIKDYRTLSPKTPFLEFQFEKYIQVFENKIDFTPNLSVLDLLFNEGSNSINYLKNSVKID